MLVSRNSYERDCLENEPILIDSMQQVPLILFDSYYYGKIVVAPLNAVLYNVFNDHAGPELYGVEGFGYYFINLLLNFNLVLLGTVFSIPMLVSFQAFQMKINDHSLMDLANFRSSI